MVSRVRVHLHDIANPVSSDAVALSGSQLWWFDDDAAHSPTSRWFARPSSSSCAHSIRLLPFVSLSLDIIEQHVDAAVANRSVTRQWQEMLS